MLRWPVAEEWRLAVGQTVSAVERRAKYILIRFPAGTGIVHLGMTGSIRLLDPELAWSRHDHLALMLSNGLQLRYRDPRRFGAWLWSAGDAAEHPLLRDLGPEPLGPGFTAAWLSAACRNRSATIKQVIMDAHVVVGVGNIYASEALHMAGIRPTRAARSVASSRLSALVDAIRKVLAASIAKGGTTLRDFRHQDGSAGYFSQQLSVYGRHGQPCFRCGTPVRRLVLGQRATYYCPSCQK